MFVIFNDPERLKMRLNVTRLLTALSLVLGAISVTARADGGVAAAALAASAQDETVAPAPSDKDICLIQGLPPADFKYVVVRKLKVKKGTYGPITAVLPQLAAEAQELGASAIINYNGGQHFGFFPWRLTRPIVSGTAIKWKGTAAPDCTAAGGATLAAVVAANKEPSLVNAHQAAAAASAARP